MFEFWVITCNQKRMSSKSRMVTQQHKKEKYFYTFFILSCWEQTHVSLQGCPHPTWETFWRFLFDYAESWPIFAGVSASYLRNIFTLFVWPCWELTYLCRGVRTLLEKHFYAFCLTMLRADIFAGVSAPYFRNIFTLFVWPCWELTYLCRGVRTLLEKHFYAFCLTMLRADISLQGCPHPTWVRTHRHSHMTIIFSPVVKFMSFVEEKIFLEVSFRTKILHWRVYGL